MATQLKTLPAKIEASIPEGVRETPWTTAAAAGSLVGAAFLLMSGRRKAALAVVLAGAAVAVLENPDTVKEIWDNMPKYLKVGQDFLLRAEDVVDDLKSKGERVRTMMNKA
ncbi:MAG TPA: hypothetical protein VMU92_13135 [Acidobacteriaceae bacterium]|nr:hypothetical protein [Acidobacteriaceae bacterium]